MVARQAADAKPKPAVPDWSRTSSQEPLPGEPPPGYDQPREQYTESDRATMKELLAERHDGNVQEIGRFLGSYAGAMTDLWGTHVSKAMEEAADDAGWSFFGKLLKFVASQGLEALAGVVTGGQSIVWKLIAEQVTALVADLAFDAAEDATKAGEMAVKRGELDAITKQLSNQLRGMAPAVIGQLEGATSYGSWIGEAELYQLARFRIPPKFVAPSEAEVRAAVAGAIITVLHGERYKPAPHEAGVISMSINIGAGGLELGAGAQMKTTKALAAAAGGASIGLLKTVPLDITLTGGEVDPAGLGPFEADWNVIELVTGYPSKGPMRITRSPSGDVMLENGSLAQHIYLCRRAGVQIDLPTLAAEIASEHEHENMDAPADEIGGQSHPLDPVRLAQRAFWRLWPDAHRGADVLIESLSSVGVNANS